MKRDRFGRVPITFEWHGLIVTGAVITNDWEADPDLPGGVHRFCPYVDEWTVEDYDGQDVLDLLTPEAQEEIEQKIIENYFDGP